MTQGSRDTILSELKKIEPATLPERPPKTPQVDYPSDTDGLVRTFTEFLAPTTGVVCRVKNKAAALKPLQEIEVAEGIKTVMTTNDEVVMDLKLKDWGIANDVKVLEAGDYTERNRFKQAVFQEADAGITSADFACAESATLGIKHNIEKVRLVSLAPPIHIAIVPIDRLVAYYEDAFAEVFADLENTPSQLTLISGPSATGDIAATPTVGMHGPKKVFVIFVG
ncbi:MAG: hypothetical protein GY866_26855 [Proteobacteria bacterium]|nr:hypothetical protein [Pseudomonadota bacterium]